MAFNPGKKTKFPNGVRSNAFDFSPNFMKTITADTTATVGESGLDYLVDLATGGVDLTLPAASTQAGLVYGLRLKAASTSTACTIEPNGTDKIAYVSAAAGKALVNTQATSQIGDYAQVVSDGVDTWYVTKMVGTWAKES